jgi:ribosomal-protein-alanine N-acetyltransferase
MYEGDRDEIEVTEPWRLPTYFSVEGQLDRIARTWPEHRALGFVAIADEQLVGALGLEDVTSEAASVGYFISSTRRGAGLATRALALLIGIAFNDVGIRTLTADIRPENVASLRVAERNGFRYVESVCRDGVDHHCLVLRADDRPEGPSSSC